MRRAIAMPIYQKAVGWIETPPFPEIAYADNS